MTTQELNTCGDKTTARIGVFNIEVTNSGRDIKVYRRRFLGKEKLLDHKSDFKGGGR